MRRDPNDGSKATIFELVDELRRSWWTAVAGICLGIAGAALAIHYSPKVFEASTISRVAPPQISEDLLRSTVTEDLVRRLLAVEDAILSRPYMEQLIDETFGRPEGEEAMQSLIERTRSRVMVATDRRSRIFSLTYRDADAALASDVVNTLTRLYIEANAASRQEQSGDTVDTFDDLVSRARTEFEAIEEELNEYRAAHPFETEQYLDFNQREKEGRSRDLEANRTQQTLVQERLRTLEDQMRQTDWTVPGAAGLPETTPVDPLTQRIRDQQRTLADLRSRYTENHPNVERAKKQLDDLIAQSGRQPRTTDSGEEAPIEPPMDPAQAALQGQIDVVSEELATLRAAEARLEREIAEIQRKIRVTPNVQRKLTELQNQYNVAETKLRGLQEKAQEASDSHYLESSQKGERIEVLEWSVVPIKPVSPQPPRVYALGLAVGLMLFVGPLVVRRLLNPLVSSEAGLRAITEIPVLVSIPRVATRENRGAARMRLLKNLGFSVVSTAVMATVFWTLG
jgi:polysaccharide chain length determinant protein (PEP-CTERM system associated)